MIHDIFNGMAKAFFADAFANMIEDQAGFLVDLTLWISYQTK